MKLFSILGAILLSAVSVAAQASTPQVFNVTSFAGSLPGGKSTVVANISETSITFSQYFDLKATSWMAPSDASSGIFGYWGGGGNVNLPAFSTWLNNASPTVNGFDVKLSIPFSVGDASVTDSTGTVKYHFGWTGGLRAAYSLDKRQTWSLAGGAEYSGIPYNRGIAYYLGLKIHI